MARELNKESLNLIKQWEGYRSKAYYDSAGVLTIGYGHTNRIGTWSFDKSAVIDEAFAEKILDMDLNDAKRAVERYVTRPMSANQYGAYVSLVHNIGSTNFSRSSTVKYFNAGNMKEAADRILLWNKARVNGKLKVLQGLVNRRNAERTLFVKPNEIEKPEETTVLPQESVKNPLFSIISWLQRLFS